MTPDAEHSDAAPAGRRRAALIAMIALGAVLACGAGWAAWITRDRGRVLDGVTVGGTAMGGMTRQAALSALRTQAARLAKGEVALRTGDRDWTHAAADLGIAYDAEAGAREAYGVGRRGWVGRRLVERLRVGRRGAGLALPARLDAAKARAALDVIAKQLGAGPRDATARVVDGQVVIVPEVPGGRLDVGESLAALGAWLDGERSGPVVLPADVKPPRVTAGDLQSVNGTLAEFSTSLAGSSRNRVHNVTLAAHAVDGHVVLPGETFSYDEVVGPRTLKAGYRTAPILRNGELVPGTGGGACQVSSTLYNIALLANMKVTRRSHHSRPVSYVKAGLDATIVYGAIDFAFENTTDSPIVLRAWVAKRRLWMQALGRMPPPKVQIVRSRRWTPAGEAVEKPDPTLPEGERVVEREAKAGLRVVVTRIVGEGAKAAREVISNDYYRPLGAVIRVGTGPAAAEEPAGEPAEEAQPATAEPSDTAPKKPDEIAE